MRATRHGAGNGLRNSTGDYSRALSVGSQCGLEQFVAQDSFVRGDTTKSIAEGSLAFGRKGCPHLQKTVWETWLEDAPGIVGNGVWNPRSVRLHHCSFERSNFQSVFGSAVE